MHPISFQPGAANLRQDPITIKDLDRKIVAIERKVDALAADILSVKQVYYWRCENKELPKINLSESIREIHNLLLTEGGIWADCERVADSTLLHSRISNIHKIQAKYFVFEKSINVLLSVGQNTFVGMYGTLSEMVDLLIRVVDPKVSPVQKTEILTIEFKGKHFDVASESPRDIGIELLKLFEMAFVQCIEQLHEISGQNDNIEILSKMLDVVKNRISSYEAHTPRFSKDQPIYPFVEETEVQRVLSSVSKSKAKFSFWSMLSRVSRLVSYIKSGECERFGDKIEKKLGTQIAGMSEKLTRKLAKIMEGKISPEKCEEFTKKLDLYGNCYMQLKEKLQNKRKKIYRLTPDSTFKTLLNYAYGLRYELREVGFLLDIVRELSRPQALQLFSAQKLLACDGTVRQKPVEKVLLYFQIGSCLKKAEKAPGEYSHFLKLSHGFMRRLFNEKLADLIEITEGAAEIWNVLQNDQKIEKKHDLFFVKAMVRAFFTVNPTHLSCEHLLLLSCLRRNVPMQQRLQQNLVFEELCSQYDTLCNEWGITELLNKSYDVLSLLLIATNCKPDARLKANAYQKFTEFEHAAFTNSFLQAAMVKFLRQKSCWQHESIEFRSLACVLYGTDVNERRVSQEYVVANYIKLRQLLSADYMQLLFENTIEKIISNDDRITVDELHHLIEGPLTEFIVNKKTAFDEMRMRLAIDRLLEKENGVAEDEQIVTQLVARHG